MINFIKQYAGLVALVILAIMSFTVFAPAKTLFGSTSCSGITCLAGGLRLVTDAGGDFEADVASVFSGTVKFGTSGTALNQFVATSCNLIGTNTSQAASSTVAYDCAVTGVTSSDKTIAQLATSTPVGGSNGWSISSSKASTTAGYVTVMLMNHGAAAVPSVTSVGSSTSVIAFR